MLDMQLNGVYQDKFDVAIIIIKAAARTKNFDCDV